MAGVGLETLSRNVVPQFDGVIQRGSQDVLCVGRKLGEGAVKKEKNDQPKNQHQRIERRRNTLGGCRRRSKFSGTGPSRYPRCGCVEYDRDLALEREKKKKEPGDKHHAIVAARKDQRAIAVEVNRGNWVRVGREGLEGFSWNDLE